MSFWLLFYNFFLFLDLALLPDEKLRFEGVYEPGLEDINERLAVHFVKSKCHGDSKDRQDKQNGDVDRQKLENGVRRAGAARQIDELLERERSEDLVFDVDELGNLETHELIITQ